MDDESYDFRTNRYAIMQEFESFKYIVGESVNELIDRFCALNRKLYDNGVETTLAQKITCLAKALPPRWNKFVEKMMEKNIVHYVGLNEFIQVIDALELKRSRNASRFAFIDDFSWIERFSSYESKVSPQISKNSPQESTVITNCDTIVDDFEISDDASIDDFVSLNGETCSDDESEFSECCITSESESQSFEDSNVREVDTKVEEEPESVPETKHCISPHATTKEKSKEQVAEVVLKSVYDAKCLEYETQIMRLRSHNQNLVDDSRSKCDEFLVDLERLRIHNQNLVHDLSKCVEANNVLKENEKDFKLKVKTLTNEVSELKFLTLNKQKAIFHYLDMLDQTKRELATTKCDYEVLKLKLESYSNASFILDYIPKSHDTEELKKNVSYNSCPPPCFDNYTKLPDEDEITEFKVTTPLVIDPKDVPSENVCESSSKSDTSFGNSSIDDEFSCDDEIMFESVEVVSDSDSGFESEVVNSSLHKSPSSHNQKPIQVPLKSKLKESYKKVKSVFKSKRVHDFEFERQRKQGSKDKVQPPEPILKLEPSKSYYHKKCFNKSQVWLSKDSVGSSDSPLGQWMDITFHDDHGRAQTTRGWVLND